MEEPMVAVFINGIIALSTLIATFLSYKMYQKSQENRRLTKYDILISELISRTEIVKDASINYWTVDIEKLNKNNSIKINQIETIKSNIKTQERLLKILDDDFKDFHIDINELIKIFNQYNENVTGWESEIIFRLDSNKRHSISRNCQLLLNVLKKLSYKV